MIDLVVGIDPSTSNVGWAILGAQKGLFELVAYGSFKPEKQVSWVPKNEIQTFDRIRAVHLGVLAIAAAARKASKDEVAVGVEQVAFMMVSLQSMATGAGASAAAMSACWSEGLAPLPVVPTSWQAMIQAPGLGTKERALMLARTLYGAPDTIDEDTADAIAVAHYTAHRRGYMPFIDDEVFTMEIGMRVDLARKLGREAVEEIRGKILADRKDRKAARRYVAERAAYLLELKEYRKRSGMPPKSKARIDVTAKAPALPGASVDKVRLRRLLDGKELLS